MRFGSHPIQRQIYLPKAWSSMCGSTRGLAILSIYFSVDRPLYMSTKSSLQLLLTHSHISIDILTEGLFVAMHSPEKCSRWLVVSVSHQHCAIVEARCGLVSHQWIAEWTFGVIIIINLVFFNCFWCILSKRWSMLKPMLKYHFERNECIYKLIYETRDNVFSAWYIGTFTQDD